MAKNYLPEENLLTGISKIASNACELLSNASLMYENKKYARAFGLYQIAINEINEAYAMLRGLLFFDTSSGKIPETNYLMRKSRQDENSWIINNILSTLIRKIAPQLDPQLAIASGQENASWQNGMFSQFSSNAIVCPQDTISQNDAEKKRDDAHREVAGKQQLITCIASNYRVLKDRICELELYSE